MNGFPLFFLNLVITHRLFTENAASSEIFEIEVFEMRVYDYIT